MVIDVTTVNDTAEKWCAHHGVEVTDGIATVYKGRQRPVDHFAVLTTPPAARQRSPTGRTTPSVARVYILGQPLPTPWPIFRRDSLQRSASSGDPASHPGWHSQMQGRPKLFAHASKLTSTATRLSHDLPPCAASLAYGLFVTILYMLVQARVDEYDAEARTVPPAAPSSPHPGAT